MTIALWRMEGSWPRPGKGRLRMLDYQRTATRSRPSIKRRDWLLSGVKALKQLLFQDQPGVTVRYWCEAGRVTREGLTLLNNLRHNDPPIRPVAAAAPAMAASVIGMPWSIRSVVALLEQREGLG